MAAEDALAAIVVHGPLQRMAEGYAAGPLAVPIALVEIMLSRSWLAATTDGFTLSPEGRAALKRRLAGGDSFRAQHQMQALDSIETPNGRQAVIRNQSESPLGWLCTRRDKAGRPLISHAQFTAGERLRADFTRGGMQPRVTASWDPTRTMSRSGGSAPGGESDTRLAARERVRRALAATGPELGAVLLDVCCFERGLETAEAEAGWPQRSGKVVLGLALTALARHYGLIAEGDAARPIASRLTHWGVEGYRPAIGD